MKFQNIVVDALATNYGRYGIFRNRPSLRLVTAAVNRSEAMATMFATNGHTYQFEGRSANEARQDGSDDEAHSETSHDPASDDDPLPVQSSDQSGTSSVRQYLDHTVVDDLLPNTLRVAKPQHEEIFDWLHSIYRDSRGFEIGTVNPTLLANIMKEQSRKWKDIALGYVADLIVLTHTFVNDLLEEVCPTQRLREGILSLLMDHLCVRYKAIIKHVDFLLNVELNGTPSTLNHYFNDNLQKWYALKCFSLPSLLIRFTVAKKECTAASKQRPSTILSMGR